MYKIIVFTHGDLAKSLKDTAELISGANELVECYGIPLGVDTNAVLSQVSASIKDAEKTGLDVLILTDLFFGTPFNLLISIVPDHKFSHVTGVNLPMLLEAFAFQDRDDKPFAEIVSELVSNGREAIDDCDVFVQRILSKKSG